jgi:hypothetical protein
MMDLRVFCLIGETFEGVIDTLARRDRFMELLEPASPTNTPGRIAMQARAHCVVYSLYEGVLCPAAASCCMRCAEHTSTTSDLPLEDEMAVGGIRFD